MSSKEVTFDFLQRKKEEVERAGGVEVIEEWQSALVRLMEQISRWLSEAKEKGLLEFRMAMTPVCEENVRPYGAASISITAVGGRRIDIEPRARFVVGATGRLDFKCPPKEYALVRKKDLESWEFVRIGRAGWERREFSEENFWDVIRDLLS